MSVTLLLSFVPCSPPLQLQTGSYDADSNRELLKLYAVAPDMIKLDILSRLLVKCLMELPSPDFFTSMYLIAESLHTMEPLKLLLKLQSLLETCQFKRFWKEVDAFKSVAANAAIVNFAEVKDFDDAIRRFISLTVAGTYASISTAQLKELWNVVSDARAHTDDRPTVGRQRKYRHCLLCVPSAHPPVSCLCRPRSLFPLCPDRQEGVRVSGPRERLESVRGGQDRRHPRGAGCQQQGGQGVAATGVPVDGGAREAHHRRLRRL